MRSFTDRSVNQARCVTIKPVETSIRRRRRDLFLQLFVENRHMAVGQYGLGNGGYFYGDGFPYYLRDNTAARALPYLWDVARFDLRIDRAAHASVAEYTEAITIDAHLQVRLASSLSCLQVEYPVDLLRDCLDAGRPEELSGLDMTPQTRHFAIWRGPEGAAVKRLSPASAAFLNALLEGAAAEQALRQAMECASATDVLAAIQTELFGASFMRLTRYSHPGNPP